jgi:mono/diheme cytochrome c family protein
MQKQHRLTEVMRVLGWRRKIIRHNAQRVCLPMVCYGPFPPKNEPNVMDPTMRIMLSAFVGAFLITTTSQVQQDPRVQRGRAFAQTHCASCHAIGHVGESPLLIAPPFRTLHLRYPVEDLAESLAEGIMTAHRAMPQFQLDSGQIADLIAYLKSLEP